MSYQVIARKYRPQRFSDVVGQEHVTTTLGNAIAQNRIAHAYLFCGPRGTGKTTIARIFAKCLNCTGGPKVDFADDDTKANEIAEGRSLDVLEIDGASNRGIDEIRDLRDTVKYAPATSKFKIYIIDEVHMLTKEAFNALLKTLEEPPAHVKFMFATTEPEKVLPTILSRCQRFDLRRIPAALIVKHLTYIAKQEKVILDDAALFAIARGADGGLRDAESTLDQLISFCGDKIEERDVLSMFGLTAQAQLLALSKAMLDGDANRVLSELNDLAQNGKDLNRLLSDLLNHFRNLLVFQVTKGNVSILEVSEAEAATLKEHASAASTDALTRIMEVLTDAESRLRDAGSKRIFVEVALLRAIEARNAVSIDTILRRLEAMRGGAVSSPATRTLESSFSESASAKRPISALGEDPTGFIAAPAPASAPSAQRPPAAAGSPDLDSLWSSLVDAAGRASPFIRAYLLEAHPVALENKVLTIGFDPEFKDHIALVDNSRNHTLLQTKLAELGHGGTQVKFIQAERPTRLLPPVPETQVEAQSPAPPPAATRSGGPARSAQSATPPPEAAPGQFEKEAFKNDPLIAKALELFKGAIVEVRS
jgi:DNA polymerase-3 subunit gamma/tau